MLFRIAEIIEDKHSRWLEKLLYGHLVLLLEYLFVGSTIKEKQTFYKPFC